MKNSITKKKNSIFTNQVLGGRVAYREHLCVDILSKNYEIIDKIGKNPSFLIL